MDEFRITVNYFFFREVGINLFAYFLFINIMAGTFQVWKDKAEGLTKRSPISMPKAIFNTLGKVMEDEALMIT